MDLIKKVEQLKGKRDSLREELKKSIETVQVNSEKIKKYEEAREIVRKVAIKTQEQLQFHISDITSLALESVFTDPYELKMEFVERRNKTECDLLFEKNGEKVDPLESSGYGAVDIATFALRLASWSLNKDNSRNTIILDEPMKFVSEDLRESAAFMLKEISKKLGIQLIVVTHDPVLASWADKCFKVTQRKKRFSKWKVSKVREV